VLPRPLSCNKEDLLLREGEECRERKEGKAGEGREGSRGDPIYIFKFSLE